MLTQIPVFDHNDVTVGKAVTDSRIHVGRRLAAAHGIQAGTRIGVDYAGDWARRKWRFTLSGDRFVSV